MRIDWFRLITELERNGVTLRAQSSAVGVALGTVYGWKSGSEPKYYHGQILINLYARTLGESPPLQSTFRST